MRLFFNKTLLEIVVKGISELFRLKASQLLIGYETLAKELFLKKLFKKKL